MPYNRYNILLDVEWVKLEDLIDLSFDLITLLGYSYDQSSIVCLFSNYKKYPKLGSSRFPDDFFISNTDHTFVYLKQAIIESTFLFQVVPLSRALFSFALDPTSYISRKIFEERTSLIWED